MAKHAVTVRVTINVELNVEAVSREKAEEKVSELSNDGLLAAIASGLRRYPDSSVEIEIV